MQLIAVPVRTRRRNMQVLAPLTLLLLSLCAPSRSARHTPRIGTRMDNITGRRASSDRVSTDRGLDDHRRQAQNSGRPLLYGSGYIYPQWKGFSNTSGAKWEASNLDALVDMGAAVTGNSIGAVSILASYFSVY